MHRLQRVPTQLAHDTVMSPLFERLMRLGFAVRGLIYGFIGVLAFRVAMGGNGFLTDPQGAIMAMGTTPIGSMLLYAILVGLIGYSLWGIVRAVFDPLHKGNDLKGTVIRIGYLVSAISYGFLAAVTYGLITGTATVARNGSQTAQTQQTAASLFRTSWGPWVIALVGLILIGDGLFQISEAMGNKFDRQFRPYVLNAEQRLWIHRLGRFGTAARGLVFGLIGLFLFLAAYRHDPSEARGFDGVLAALLHQPYGPWLLALVALGLVAFGIYSAMSGLWLRFRR